LALAILAGALAALGEVMRVADRNAAMARDETEAQMIASTIMDELVSGARQLAAVQQTPYDAASSPPWLYSIEFLDTGMQLQELIAVRVRVEQGLEPQFQPVQFELLRWLPNPDALAEAESEEESNSSSSSSSSSSSGSSSSSSSSSGIGGQQ
jgi:hypothetical protein